MAITTKKKKIHWSCSIPRSNCCGKVSEHRVLLDGGDVVGTPVQCPHGKSQVQSGHHLCSWANVTFLGKNNTFREVRWLWLNEVFHRHAGSCSARLQEHPFLKFRHNAWLCWVIFPSSSLPHRFCRKSCRDCIAPGCSFIWGFLLALFFSSTAEFAEPLWRPPSKLLYFSLLECKLIHYLRTQQYTNTIW